MDENNMIEPSSSPAVGRKSGSIKTLVEQIPLWVGVIGSLITITLTVWNTHTKSEIDKREEGLKELEVRLKERTTGLEESREKVDRYKWVLSLFNDLNEKDEKKKNFTIGLVRLALTPGEAEQLFAGLQTSSDKELQSLGQSGITAIQNEPIGVLVSQMNATTADVRKSAVATLVRDYKSSSQAITFALRMYDPDRIDNLSPSGVINGLYYLSATDPAAWGGAQAEAGRQLASRLEARGGGQQTKAALETFKSLLQKLTTEAARGDQN
jgi:hypothetical protein